MQQASTVSTHYCSRDQRTAPTRSWSSTATALTATSAVSSSRTTSTVWAGSSPGSRRSTGSCRRCRSYSPTTPGSWGPRGSSRVATLTPTGPSPCGTVRVGREAVDYVAARCLGAHQAWEGAPGVMEDCFQNGAWFLDEGSDVNKEMNMQGLLVNLEAVLTKAGMAEAAEVHDHWLDGQRDLAVQEHTVDAEEAYGGRLGAVIRPNVRRRVAPSSPCRVLEARPEIELLECELPGIRSRCIQATPWRSQLKC